MGGGEQGHPQLRAPPRQGDHVSVLGCGVSGGPAPPFEPLLKGTSSSERRPQAGVLGRGPCDGLRGGRTEVRVRVGWEVGTSPVTWACPGQAAACKRAWASAPRTAQEARGQATAPSFRVPCALRCWTQTPGLGSRDAAWSPCEGPTGGLRKAGALPGCSSPRCPSPVGTASPGSRLLPRSPNEGSLTTLRRRRKNKQQGRLGSRDCGAVPGAFPGGPRWGWPLPVSRRPPGRGWRLGAPA